MKAELEHKLVKRFPWLFADYHGDMRTTCMTWGMECGSGWYNILYMLGLALEDEYKRILPLHKRLYYKALRFIIPVWNTLMRLQPKFMQHKTAFGYWPRFHKHLPYFPRASQVKEKYGTLRFYMTTETEVMSQYIAIAERASANTCEHCGGWGEVRTNGGWLKALCRDHAKEQGYLTKDELIEDVLADSDDDNTHPDPSGAV